MTEDRLKRNTYEVDDLSVEMACNLCPPYRFCPWTCVVGAYVPDAPGAGLVVFDAAQGYGLHYEPVNERLFDTFDIL